MKSIETCLTDFMKDIELRKQVDYGNKASVRRDTAANDRIRKNLLYIDKHYPAQIRILEDLLSHPDPDVVSHIAIVMQDFSNCSTEQKWRAIEALKKLVHEGVLFGPDEVTLSKLLIPKMEARLTEERKMKKYEE